MSDERGPKRIASGHGDRDDGAVRWILEKMDVHDPDVVRHFWHLTDGRFADCGCPYEGESQT